MNSCMRVGSVGVKIESRPERCVGCLICQMICSFVNYGVFNISKAKVKITRGVSGTLIEFREDCKKCGSCARWCVYGALVIGR